MNKKYKNLISLFLCVLFVLSITTFVSADQIIADDEVDMVAAKKALAAKYADNYIEGFAETMEGKERANNVAELICQSQAGLISEHSACMSLEALGVYKLDTLEIETASTYCTNSHGVTLNRPSIYYDSTDRLWYVSGGGYWNSDSYWEQDIPSPFLSSPCSVGSTDGIGVMFYNTSGTYVAVKNRYAYFSDGNGNYDYSPNPVSGNSAYGSFFNYQDKIYREITSNSLGDITNIEYSYMGKHFAAMIIYDSDFENYNGIAATCYAHTSSGCAISSVTLSTSGIDIQLSNTSYGFTINSQTETSF